VAGELAAAEDAVAIVLILPGLTVMRRKAGTARA
jgi:hypothetical protein